MKQETQKKLNRILELTAELEELLNQKDKKPSASGQF